MIPKHTLRELAEKATPGPWIPRDMSDIDDMKDDILPKHRPWFWIWQEAAMPYYGGVVEMDTYDDEGHPGAIGACEIDGANNSPIREWNDAQYIAAISPDKLIELLDELERLQALEAEVEFATEPGKWFKAVDENGKMLAETSNPREFGPDMLDLKGKPGVTFYRQYRAELEEWREIPVDELPTTPRNRRTL